MGLLASDVGAGNSHVDVVGCLEKIFSKGKSGFGSDRTAERVDPCNLQYGEVTYQGMEPLYDALGLRKGDVFYDLGCGVGKLVLYVALRGEISRSVGLEVGERRHVLAEGACKQLSGELEIQRAGGISELPTLGAACADFSVLLADISRQRYFDPTVVVLTNLCMDMGVQNRTVTCLLRCPSFRRLVSITPMLPHARLKLVGSVQVACTWAKVSAWQVYDVLPPPEPLARSGSLSEVSLQVKPRRSLSTPSLGSKLEQRHTVSGFLPSVRQGKKDKLKELPSLMGPAASRCRQLSSVRTSRKHTPTSTLEAEPSSPSRGLPSKTASPF
eukprot:TRINITY_DN4246_c0_g1_i1.p1 TRINITY_DN4246_c0_g1~~TRINITY_DN4246_c0_g1_i1.p1  ORF type:complete len:328 (+),score=62.00 TRINITY_DN4246_c0_g1_i1:79-1062(+)